MNCKKCGTPLPENARFCGNCGSMVETVAPQPDPVSYAAPMPSSADGSFTQSFPKNTKKLPKIVLPIIGGAAAVILVLILLISGAFAGSKATVAKAFATAISEYTAVADELKLSDIAGMTKSGKYNQSLKLWIEDGGYELEGLGIRLDLSYNQSGKEAAVIAAPIYENVDLITAQMKFKDSKIYVGSPELLGKTFVVLDSKTIGQDLADKNAPGMEDLSFNLFELIEQMQKTSEITKEQQKALTKAGAAFVKAIEVKKDGKNNIKVNGNQLKCTVYNVVIPQDSIEAFLDALEAIAEDMNPMAAFAVLENAGFPVEDMDLDAADLDTTAIFDSLKDVVDELGDIKAQIGIHKGYVVSIKNELEIDNEVYTLDIQLGGGKNYVDDLYIEMLDEDEYGFIVTSTGNHAMEKGVFTDETSVIEVYRGQEEEAFVSELTWNTKGKENNFEWTLESYGDEFTFEGTVITSKNSLAIFTDDLYIEGVTLGISYTLGDYKAPSIKTGSALTFADMSEEDLMELVEQCKENAEEWMETMEDEYGDLISDLLWYLY